MDKMSFGVNRLESFGFPEIESDDDISGKFMPPDIPEGNLQTRNFDLGCNGLDKLGKLDYLFNNGGVYKSNNSYESTHKPTRNTYTPPSFNFSPPPPNNVSGDNGTFSNFDKDMYLPPRQEQSLARFESPDHFNSPSSHFGPFVDEPGHNSGQYQHSSNHIMQSRPNLPRNQYDYGRPPAQHQPTPSRSMPPRNPVHNHGPPRADPPLMSGTNQAGPVTDVNPAPMGGPPGNNSSGKSCRSQNLSFPDIYYTNEESRDLLHELRQVIQENQQAKGVLKSKIFKILNMMDKNLTLSDAVEFLVEIQGAFNRTDQQQICNDICHDKGVGQIVGMLVNFRHGLQNDQKLKVARSLLRVSWSLTFSTISDLVNALHPHRNSEGQLLYTVDELELFCQCLHNFYLLENVDKAIINTMAETATQFMTTMRVDPNGTEDSLKMHLYKLTIVYKCYGKRLSQTEKNTVCEAFETFVNKGVMKGDNLFNDNRSCVVHVLDSLYRAESHLPRFAHVIENCVNELAMKNVILTTQDISAVLRVFQRYRDTNTIQFCVALQKVATAMNERIIKGLNGEKVRAKDFLKNMKILSSKYFVDILLYEQFCTLVDRDLKEECKCSKKPCPKSCLMLDFCNLADVLDSLSTVNYIYKDKSSHLYFLHRIADRLTEPAIVQTFFNSPHRNKAQKLMYILQNFQIYGFYPHNFINDDQFDKLYQECNYFRSYYLIKEQEYKFNSFDEHGIDVGSSKTGQAKIDMYLQYNQTHKPETIQAKNLIKMEERVREVLYEMNFDTLKQSHSVCNNAVYFIINDETAVLPLARVKFCRNKNGSVESLDGLSGKITPVYRMLRKQYRYVLQVPYYEFEKEPGKEAEYIQSQLEKLQNGQLPEAVTSVSSPSYDTNPILSVETSAMPVTVATKPVMPMYRSHSMYGQNMHSENAYSSAPEPIIQDEGFASHWNSHDTQYSTSNNGGYNGYNSNRHVNYGNGGGGGYYYRNNENGYNNGGGRAYFGRSRSHEPYSNHYQYGQAESGGYYGAHHHQNPPPPHHQQRMSYQYQ